MATALRAIQRDIVQLGDTSDAARAALVLARTLDMATARSAQDLATRFTPAPGSAERYPVLRHLRQNAQCSADHFTTDAYLCLSQSHDLHDIDPRRIRVPVTAIAFEPDVVAPVWQVRSMVEQLAGSWTLRVIRSRAGHDAFREETAVLAPMIADALVRHVTNTVTNS
jgi:homoserine O-acetyltransferase